MATNSAVLGKVHNFGIYFKKGKRAILQLDFPGESLNIIQRGHIKKSIKFQELTDFDSAEDLHIVLKHGEIELEFQADNSEEKYTICRLLSLVIDTTDSYDHTELQHKEPTGNILSIQPPVSLRQEHVLKDGLLEKKGNTTITTWNKRRVKISAGEFSYYKPGDDLALNIVQIWDGSCQIKRVGFNGFNVIIRDSRTYSFRCIQNDGKSKNIIENEREAWVKVFDKAIHTRRNTLVYIDEGLLSSQLNKTPTSPLTTFKDEPKYEDMQELNTFHPRTPEIKAHLSVSVNYVTDMESSTKASIVSKPSMSRNVPVHVSNPPITIPNLDQIVMRSPENIYSVSTGFNSKNPGVSPQPKAHDEQQETEEMSVSDARTLFENKIKRMSSNEDFAELKKSDKTPTSLSSIESPFPDTAAEEFLQPPGPPPPPPPLLNVKRAGVKLLIQPSVKLKQAHWIKLSNNTASHSIWKDMHDVTKNLNLKMLEEQFALKEKDDKRNSREILDVSNKKTLLLDPKRAHVLGIIVNSLKISGHLNVSDFLSTMQETDTFPSETLSTIRSCQPTDDDIEMYKVYNGSNDDLMPVDKFMCDLCQVPQIGLRLELIQIVWEFPKTYDAILEEVEDIWLACDEVVGCRKLISLLEYVLAIGNLLNAKWSSGYGVRGFEITSIDKVLHVKGKGNTTILGYLIHTLRKNEPELLDWAASLGHVSIAAEYSVKAIGAELEVLKNDIAKVKRHMKVLKPLFTSKQEKKFQSDVQIFIVENERKLDKLITKSHQLTNKYSKTLEYFGESTDRSSDVFFGSIHKFMEEFQQARTKPHK